MSLASDNHAHALKAFLCRPEDNECFLEFYYKTCYVLCRGYLKYLRAIGWNLPLDQRTDIDPIDDLTVDVLGELLRCDKGRQYLLIFDYFGKQGITDFESSDADDLLRLFKAMLRRFTRQELGRLKKGTDPQVSKLKKRFANILNGQDYIRFKGEGSSIEHICLKQFADDLRQESEPVTRKLLEEIVTESMMCTTKETELCKNVFIRLNGLSEYQSCIPYWELITVLITIRATYAEEGFPLPSRLMSPSEELLQREIDRAMSRAIERVREVDIKRFVANKRLTAKEGLSFVQGCRLYLVDSCNGTGTDLIPTYFREVMPGVSQGEYLKKYKYIFEMIISKAVEYLREGLGDNPIIGGIGIY